MDRASIKERARFVVRGYRGPSIGVLVLYFVLIAAVGWITFGLGEIFLIPPIAIGLTMFYLGVWRAENPPFETLFAAFRRYTQALVGMLWMYLWTFLWSLLFLIPGVIKSYAYSMTPYLLADYPDLDPREALKVSMAITAGHKMEIFVMQVSFLGWLILSAFTLNILYFVYVGPYMETAMAGLYESLLADALDRGVITQDNLFGWNESRMVDR